MLNFILNLTKQPDMKSSKKLISRLKDFNMQDLSILPTPLQRLNKLSSELGANIYCKRDDLTGFAFGGNKTRKLDYLISDALQRGADSIVTFGSNQSNWCRMTAAAGSANGLKVYLFLSGQTPSVATGNLILDYLAGAEITHIDSDDDDVILNASMKKYDELSQAGKNPYFIKVGGSNALGSLGYVRAFYEILTYCKTEGVDFTKIFVGAGSAGTQAGLVAGKILSGWSGDIIGVSVSREHKEQEKIVAGIVSETLELLGERAGINRIDDSVIVDDNYLGKGYRKNTTEGREAIELFATREGIFLDEVYTGKTASGLIDYCRRGRISPGEDMLFIHTGGAVQLFE